MSVLQASSEPRGTPQKALPEDFPAMYRDGLSINEIAERAGRSFEFVRKRLLKEGAKLRSKEEGTALYRQRHPEYWDKVLKWKVKDAGVVTEAKLLLMCMIITEGCISRHTIQFANTQEILHERFRDLVQEAYGEVKLGRNGLNSRICSKNITDELAPQLEGKVFSKPVMEHIMSSQHLAKKIGRIIADTEGSMILSVRKAPRNYTVEHRIVLASTNPPFSEQVSIVLRSMGIGSRINRVGVQIMRAEDVTRFIKVVGFTPGLHVIRKKAGYGIWYGKDKSVISQVFLRVSQEQKRSWGRRGAGVFADCKTREETVERLMSIYQQVSGG